jgi:nucleoid-associated protein YgaU
MNTSNPFQVSCNSPFAEIQQQRRERFRKKVMLGVVALAALLVILLIEGCVSEHKTAAAMPSMPANAEVATVAAQPVAAQPQTQPLVAAVPAPTRVLMPSQPSLACLSNTPALSAKAVLPANTHSELLYVVKSGDTLARIARQHHTTSKTLKTINGLNTDSIAVGAKLKLPSV